LNACARKGFAKNTTRLVSGWGKGEEARERATVSESLHSPPSGWVTPQNHASEAKAIR